MNKFFYFFWGVLQLLVTTTNAQINITYPTTRAVFQRNNSNQTLIYIAGNYTSFSDKIEARAVARPMSPSQGSTTNWTIIQTNPTNGFYYGSLTVMGGWYDLEVRAWNGTTLLGSTSVQRIGVGEVFLIGGQSNATGDGGLKSQGNYGPMANDDRVSIVNYIAPYNTSFGGIVLPNPIFSRLDSTMNIAPFGESAWCWGALGDTLTKKLNVPVAFFNGGWSGTGITAWHESANDSTATPFNYYTMPRGMPYGNFRAALHFYINQFGVRAVLWHQGETDNQAETSRTTYGSYLKNVITKSRQHSGKNNLTWVVSRASRYKGFQITNSRVWQPVIDAQNDVIGVNGNTQNNYINGVFEGPETDNLIGPNIRTSDSIHFVGGGHRILASVWSQKLNTNFFNNSTPYLPTPPPLITTECNGISNLLMKAPSGQNTYLWTNNNEVTNNLSTSTSYSASSGSYRVKTTDALGNILISPQVSVPSNFAGLIPITSFGSGTWHDNNTWVCGRIPTSIDLVTINTNHEVIVGNGLTARFKRLELKGTLRFFSTGRLQNIISNSEGN